ncbi:MAG: prolyl oligopeptidase family serine peptidase [Melioribacteraceae bacterium]|nr:prolyl oligopeptidase family serine peptidase [Melioribacteraceae bacterium]
MKNKYVLIVLLAFIFSGCANSVVFVSGTQSHQKLKTEICKTVELEYLLYTPDNYSETDEKLPLLLFLHGSGERGNDLNKVKVHGPPKLIEEGKKFPFIVVSPQCPEGKWWSIEDLEALLNNIIEQYKVDEDRIYLTGLSMGGFGTWEFAIEFPGKFAAIAPVCGGGNKFAVDRIKHIPIWVFHGAKDNVVKPEQSEVMVEALEKVGSDVKFTLYPEATHNSWTETYNNEDLYNWFLEQKRK